MRNSLGLPLVSIIVAIALVAITLITRSGHHGSYAELQIGAIAWATGLVIYALQGMISVISEGRELHPGRTFPRLTGPLSVLIIVGSVALLGVAVSLAIGLTRDWQSDTLGAIAGAGCLVLAALLVLYKEAFVGEEATLDSRDDGIPW
jgi:hypothetical protein